jgi:UDP-N-acetylmuramate dehydrogenase
MVIAAETLAERLRGRMRGSVLAEARLDRYTSFRIGGAASLLAKPMDREDLKAALAFAREEALPVHVLGGGSNTLIRDGGLRGMVIRLDAFQRLERREEMVEAGAGVRVSRLLAFCCRCGLAGLEILSGIPGTLGGAVWGNAGAWGGSAADRLAWLDLITSAGEERRVLRDAVPFGYRASGLPMGAVVVQAVFRLSVDDAAAIRRRISGYLVRRNACQPLEFRSAGSIFKNPPGDFAGRLVERAGLKGTRIGNAMISSKHGNFIVNTGGARAADVLALVALAQERVRAATGIALELEIRVVGDEEPRVASCELRADG